MAHDGKSYSFVVEMENGRESIRHKQHLRHFEKGASTRDTQVLFGDSVCVASMDTGMMTRARQRAIANLGSPVGAGVLKNTRQ